MLILLGHDRRRPELPNASLDMEHDNSSIEITEMQLAISLDNNIQNFNTF